MNWKTVSIGVAGIVLLHLPACHRPATKSATRKKADEIQSSGEGHAGVPNTAQASPGEPSARDAASKLHALLKHPAGPKRTRQLRKLLDAATAAQAPLLLRELMSSHVPNEEFEIALNLISAWAAADPHAALEFAKHLPDHYRSQAITAAVQGWAEQDEAAAAAWVEANADQKVRRPAEAGLVLSIAETDPSRAIAMLQRDPEIILSGGYLVFSEMVETDPAEAARAVLQLPPGRGQAQALEIVAGTWLNSDPAAAVSWMQSLPPLKRQAFGEFISNNFTATDPGTAVQIAMLMPATDRDATLASVLRQWAAVDQAGALAFINQLPPSQRSPNVLSSYTEGLAQSSYETAMNFAMQSKNAQERQSLQADVIKTWLQGDVSSGLEWLNQHPEIAGQRGVMLQAVQQLLAYQSPEQAALLAQSIPDQNAQSVAFQNIGSSWGRDDPGAAQNFLNQMPEGDARDKFLLGMIRGMAQTNAAMAGQIVTGMPAGSLRDHAMQNVANVWGQYDPSSALAWVSQFGSSPAANNAVGQIVRHWTWFDSNRASQYLQTLSSGAMKDGAISAFVSSISSTNPEEAIPWINSITDPSVRLNSLQNAVNNWMKKDKSQAQAWVQAASIPADWKTKLLGGKG